MSSKRMFNRLTSAVIRPMMLLYRVKYGYSYIHNVVVAWYVVIINEKKS